MPLGSLVGGATFGAGVGVTSRELGLAPSGARAGFSTADAGTTRSVSAERNQPPFSANTVPTAPTATAAAAAEATK
jgi:hypothetical protein